MRDLRFLAALIGDLPDVVDALHHLWPAELDALFARGRIGDVVDLAVAAVHRPEAIAFIFLVAQPGELLRGHIHDPQVRSVTAAIVFARPGGRMAGEREAAA